MVNDFLIIGRDRPPMTSVPVVGHHLYPQGSKIGHGHASFQSRRAVEVVGKTPSVDLGTHLVPVRAYRH